MKEEKIYERNREYLVEGKLQFRNISDYLSKKDEEGIAKVFLNGGLNPIRIGAHYKKCSIVGRIDYHYEIKELPPTIMLQVLSNQDKRCERTFKELEKVLLNSVTTE